MVFIDNQILFSLLRNALGLSDELPDCSSVQWPEFFRFAQQQSIAPLLVPTIAKLPTDQLPPRNIWIPWLAEQDKARNKYQAALAAVDSLTCFLSSHGIPTLIFKGLTLADCYPDPSLRPFSDIDIYHFGKHKEADQLLRDQLGITIVDRAQPHTQYMYSPRHPEPQVGDRQWSQFISGSRCPDIPILFENHYSFLNLQSIPSNRAYEQLLESLLPTPPQNSKFKIQNFSTFTALYMMRHMAGHFAASAISLRHLCDWRMFLDHHSSEIDWHLVNATFADHHMTSFADAITELSTFNFQNSKFKIGFSGSPTIVGSTGSPTIVQNSEFNIQNSTFNILNSILSPPAPHPSESLSRFFWKIRRYRHNRWKRRITCRDSECSLLLHALTSHLRNPYTLLHRV